jgi:hypothetical protein
MLVICDNKEIMQKCHDLKHDKKLMASHLASWLGDTGMTAKINKNYAMIDLKMEAHPSTVKFGSLVNKDLDKDVTLCQLTFQKHKCSKYCMHNRTQTKKNETKEEKKRRWC